MKHLILSIFFLSCFSGLLAQESESYDYYDPDAPSFNRPAESIEPGAFKPRPRIGMMTGTGVSLMGGRNTFVNSFFAPHISYDLSPRLSINAAAILSNTQMNPGADAFNNANFNSRHLFMGLEYKITENLSIGGAVQISNGLGSGFNDPMFNRSFSPAFSPFFSPIRGW